MKSYCLKPKRYLILSFTIGGAHVAKITTPKGGAIYVIMVSANKLEPYAYIRYVLEHIGSAKTLEEVEALLPWNAPLEKNLKIASAYGKDK